MSEHTRRTGFRILVLLLCAGLIACSEDELSTTSPQDQTEQNEPPPEADPGLSAHLTAEPMSATPGETVVVRGVARGTGEDAFTATGFRASLSYRADAITPVATVEPAGADEAALRVVNTEAGPSMIKAAGAAPEGFTTSTLFAVRMKVEAPGWKDGLALDLAELNVMENDFAEVSDQVSVTTRVLAHER